MEEKFTEDIIIEQATAKGCIFVLEPKVDRVIQWLWLTHKLHIFTKIKEHKDGDLFFHYHVQDYGYRFGIVRESLNEVDEKGYMFEWDSKYAGILNLLSKL